MVVWIDEISRVRVVLGDGRAGKGSGGLGNSAG